MEKQLVKGIILKSRLDFLTHRFGPDAIDRILPHLKGQTLELFSDPKRIRATGWYDLEINIEIDDAIKDVLANGDNRIFWELGAFTNDFQTTDTSKHAYGDPWKYLTLHCNIMPRFWRPGKAELVMVNEGEALIRFHVVWSTRDYCLTNIGFFHKGLELAGAEDVEVVETKCRQDPRAPYCEYRLRFRMPTEDDR